MRRKPRVHKVTRKTKSGKVVTYKRGSSSYKSGKEYESFDSWEHPEGSVGSIPSHQKDADKITELQDAIKSLTKEISQNEELIASHKREIDAISKEGSSNFLVSQKRNFIKRLQKANVVKNNSLKNHIFTIRSLTKKYNS